MSTDLPLDNFELEGHSGNGIQAVIDTAVASAIPTALEEGKRYAISHQNGVVIVDNDLDQYRDRPRRQSGTIVVRDGASLLSLVDDLGYNVRVYADPVGRSITAVLNDADQSPAFRDHRVTLALSPTVEWKRWAAKDGNMMTQADFAEHLEDCALDIAEPTSAELLEIAQSLQATNAAEFKSGVRLASGQRQFQYVETIAARAGQAGELLIPETFKVALTPWTGGDKPYAVTARLRFRITGDGLRLGYRLVDPDRILEAAFEDVLTPIRAADLTVILGTP